MAAVTVKYDKRLRVLVLLYFRAYNPHTHIPRTESHFQYKNVYSPHRRIPRTPTGAAKASVAYSGGVGGGSTPPPMTGRTKIFSIKLKKMVYSVLCVIYAVSLAQ